MSFNSIPYLLLLPLVALVSRLLSGWTRVQNLFLLSFSLFFYGYWDWRFLGLLGASILVDFVLGMRIADTESPVLRRRWMVTSLAFNLGLLAVFKYYDFFTDSLQALLAQAGIRTSLPLLRVVLPVGISFYTFQSISYIVDVYRRQMRASRSLIDYALYVSFFPHLVAGPIQRSNLLTQLEGTKRPSFPQAREGAYLVLYGLFLKIAVGDSAGSLVDFIWSSCPEAGWRLLSAGAVAFSLQIYGDFAGYSAIARGSAKLLGVELMRNFECPYFSADITEFWKRWHVSLSSWLRDYLYIPLGGSRLGTMRTCLNLMTVMLLGGLWHGASWTFVIWGGLHGILLVSHRLLRGALPPLLSRGTSALFTFALVTLAWIFFRARSPGQALEYLQGIFSLRPDGPEEISRQIWIVMAFWLPLEWLAFRKGTEAAPLSWPWPCRGLLYAFLVLSILGGLGAQRAFLYFQF